MPFFIFIYNNKHIWDKIQGNLEPCVTSWKVVKTAFLHLSGLVPETLGREVVDLSAEIAG